MHDIGVLFVHGIGDHEAGHTLSSMGGSLADAFDASPAFTVTGRSADGAAIAFRLSTDSGNEETSVVFKEAHWDKQFDAPSLLRVIGWSLIVTPWVLHREAFRWSARRRHISKREAVGQATGMVSLGIFLLRFFVFLALSLVVQVVVLTSLLFIWIPAVRRALHRSFVLTIGDAYAFVHDDPALTAMAEHVHGELEELGRQSRRTMVIAHSQGAAVTQRAIAAFGAPDELREVVTLGAGIGKLTALRDLASRPAAMAYWALARYAFLVMVFFAVSRESTYADDLTAGIGMGLLIALIVAPVWGSFRADRMAASIVAATPKLGEGWTWVDLWSPHDLVPDGRLRCGHHIGTGAVETVEIVTRHSWLSAHVHYFTSEQCLSTLASLIAHPPEPISGSAPWAPPDVATAESNLGAYPATGAWAAPSTPTPSERATRSRRFSIVIAAISSALLIAATTTFAIKAARAFADLTETNKTRVIVGLLRDPIVLVAAALIVLLPGVVLDAVPLRRPGRRRQRIRTTASIVLTAAALALTAVGLVSFTVLLHSVRSTPAMRAGDCFDIPRTGITSNSSTPGAEQVVEYIALPCDEDHQYQLGSIDVVPLDIGTSTRAERIATFAECAPEFPLGRLSQEQVSSVSTSTWRLCYRLNG